MRSAKRDDVDRELDEDRELAQRLARERSPFEQLVARRKFAAVATRAEFGRARSRRSKP